MLSPVINKIWPKSELTVLDVPYAVCGIAFIFLIVHLYLAAKRKTMAGFIVYLVARGIVFG